MRTWLKLLLLLASINIIVGRSVNWNSFDDFLYDYKSSEETKETFKPWLSNKNSEVKDNEISEILSLLSDIGDYYDGFDEKTITTDDIVHKKPANSDEKHNKDNDSADIDEQSKHFMNLLPFNHFNDGIEVTKSVEKKKENSDEMAENDSSEEILLFSKEASDDNSNKVSTATQVEKVDLTEASKPTKYNNVEVNFFTKDVEEMVNLLVTLSVMDDLMKVSKKSPEEPNNNDELKTKEVDEYLGLLTSILDNILQDEKRTNENKVQDSTTPKNSSEEDDENSDEITTPKNENEEKDIVTTPKTDSKEKDDVATSINNNNSNENELVSLIFQGIDDDQEHNLNGHKYKIIETSQEIKPTSSPDIPKFRAVNSFISQHNVDNNDNVVKEYKEIRQHLDSEQDVLQSNKLNLDKDFYSIISSDNIEDGINKFDKDIYVLHENLDRIKRNINALQSLSSKLYFHKMIKAAINDAQNKTK